MVYFSRLTDIVTCSISNILENEANKKSAIEQIIKEMEEGLAGAKRSVTTASLAEKRLSDEMTEHQKEMENWLAKAREAVSAKNEEAARDSLQRKQEEEHIVAGLLLQQQVSQNTLEHLSTTMRALEGRLAEARRKQKEIMGADVDSSESTSSPPESACESIAEVDETIEQELTKLKREMGLE